MIGAMIILGYFTNLTINPTFYYSIGKIVLEFQVNSISIMLFGVSIVFIISSLNFSKNLFVRKESVSLVANYILSLAFNIVIILFTMVFLFYAFTNVPVLKQITTAIKFLIDTGVKAQETAGKVGEATKNAVEGAKDSIGSIGQGIGDFFSGISGFFGVK